MRQKIYIMDSVFELVSLANSGQSIEYYFNKKEFKFDNLETTESDIDAISPKVLTDMLKANDDFEAGKVLYEGLQNLTLREASNRGFWTYLAHNELYRYIHKRWPKVENPPKGTASSYIKSHWILDKNAQGELMTHTLAGLWWAFHISVDDNRADKYELTRVFMENQNFRTRAFGPVKAARCKECFIGVVEFIIENKLNKSNFEENIVSIAPYINLLGGTKPLSFYDREWFKEKLKKKFGADIAKYGRLFRRTDKSKHPSLQTGLFDEQSPEEANTIEVNPSTLPELPIRVLNLKKSGQYQLTMSNVKEFEYNIPFTESLREGFLLQCYANGKVNKVFVQWYLDKTQNKKYVNGLCSSQVLVELLTATDNQLLVIRYRKNREWYIKIHQVNKISSRNQSHLLGYLVLYDNHDKVDYAVINAERSDELKKLILTSFNAKGKPIKNAYYKNEWNVLKTYLPNWFDQLL